MISYAIRIILLGYEDRCVQKVVKIVCLTHDMLQSVIVSGAVIYHICNGVSQSTCITALYNTSVIFLAVQHNYLQGQMLVSNFDIIITKPFPAALKLPPFGFICDILKLVYTTSLCGAMVSATSRKPAISIETIAHRVRFTN